MKNPSKSRILRKNGISGKKPAVFYCQPTASDRAIDYTLHLFGEQFLDAEEAKLFGERISAREEGYRRFG